MEPLQPRKSWKDLIFMVT